MKNYMKLAVLIFNASFLIACQKDAENTSPTPTTDKVTTAGDIKSLTEYDIQGLSIPTTIRVTKNSTTVIVSMKTITNNTVSYKTLIAQKTDGKNMIEQNSEAYLFNAEFSAKVSKQKSIDSQYDAFKKWTQLKHIKDIYRCRDSELWSLLLSHTPEQRGFAFLALGEDMIHLDLSWEVLLAIDFKSSTISGFSIEKQKTDSHKPYYTSLTLKDSEYVWGFEGSTTKSFSMFNLACNDAYEKIQPNLIGNAYIASIDRMASLESDSFLKRILDKSKFNLPRQASDFLENEDSLVIAELSTLLEHYKDYNHPSIQEFYKLSLNKIRNSNKKGE